MGRRDNDINAFSQTRALNSRYDSVHPSPRDYASSYYCDECKYERWGEPAVREALRWLCLGCAVRLGLIELKGGKRVMANISHEIKNGVDPRQSSAWRWIDGQYVSQMPLANISTWEHNPRKRFEDLGLTELAESIKEHGVQQPIVVRHVPPGPGEEGAGRLVIVMGERRFRASNIAGRDTIPCIVRTDMDDVTALTLAMAENVRRRDLNAIEEARGYGRLIEMGMRQSAIAKELGCDPSSVSNSRRLLKLPDSVQEMIAEGRLSAGHGRALLRFEEWPAVVEAMALQVVIKNTPVRDLEIGIPFTNDLEKAGLIRNIAGYYAAFDVKVCKTCPLGAMRPSQYHGEYCFRPDHYDTLNQEAKAENIRKAQEEAQRIQARRENLPGERGTLANEFAMPAKVQEKLDSALVSPGMVAGVKDLPLSIATGSKVLELSKLRHGTYETFSFQTPPAGCSEGCACRATALESNGRCVQICLDTGRLNSLKAAVTRAENKVRKTAHDLVREQLSSAHLTRHDDPELVRRLAMLLWDQIVRSSVDDRRKLALTLPPGWLNDHLAISAYEIKRDEDAWAGLAEIGLVGMVNLGVELAVRADLRSSMEYKSAKTQKADWVLHRAPTGAAEAEITAEEEAEFEDVEASPHDPDDEADASDEICVRCGATISMDLLGVPADESEDGCYRLESGVLVLPDEMNMYCSACVAAGVQVCQGCGCTDEVGCDNGCSWIAPGVCSNCELAVKGTIFGVPLPGASAVEGEPWEYPVRAGIAGREPARVLIQGESLVRAIRAAVEVRGLFGESEDLL